MQWPYTGQLLHGHIKAARVQEPAKDWEETTQGFRFKHCYSRASCLIALLTAKWSGLLPGWSSVDMKMWQLNIERETESGPSTGGERRGRRNQGAKGSPPGNGPQCLLHTERPAVQQMCLSLSAPKPFHPSNASPPPPGPTRPPAPVCERGAAPRLGFELSAVTNPEICRGDPQKDFFPRDVV